MDEAHTYIHTHAERQSQRNVGPGTVNARAGIISDVWFPLQDLPLLNNSRHSEKAASGRAETKQRSQLAELIKFSCFCVTSDAAFCFDSGSTSAIVQDKNAIMSCGCI